MADSTGAPPTPIDSELSVYDDDPSRMFHSARTDPGSYPSFPSAPETNLAPYRVFEQQHWRAQNPDTAGVANDQGVIDNPLGMIGNLSGAAGLSKGIFTGLAGARRLQNAGYLKAGSPRSPEAIEAAMNHPMWKEMQQPGFVEQNPELVQKFYETYGAVPGAVFGPRDSPMNHREEASNNPAIHIPNTARIDQAILDQLYSKAGPLRRDETVVRQLQDAVEPGSADLDFIAEPKLKTLLTTLVRPKNENDVFGGVFRSQGYGIPGTSPGMYRADPRDPTRPYIAGYQPLDMTLRTTRPELMNVLLAHEKGHAAASGADLPAARQGQPTPISGTEAEQFWTQEAARRQNLYEQALWAGRARDATRINPWARAAHENARTAPATAGYHAGKEEDLARQEVLRSYLPEDLQSFVAPGLLDPYHPRAEPAAYLPKEVREGRGILTSMRTRRPPGDQTSHFRLPPGVVLDEGEQ
jgi:hypothetical protein